MATTAPRSRLHVLTAHRPGHPPAAASLHALATAASVHGYDLAFRTSAGATAAAFLLAGLLLRTPPAAERAAVPVAGH